MADLIDRQTAIETAIEAADKWDGGYSSEREGIIRKFFDKVPAVQPDHNADSDKKAEGDCISRQMALDALARMMPRSYTPDGSHPADEEIFLVQEVFADCIEALEILPSAQPEIIRCKDCIYYDPPHVENNGVRYEYTEMPADAFDVLGTGLVTTEYGINIGGRCCRDYNAGYEDDKRVYVPENNHCGRGERRTDG